MFDEFCADSFWNGTVTWNTEITGRPPDFTDCFEKTALAWAPAAFLWTFAPLECWYANLYARRHGYSSVSALRVLSRLPLLHWLRCGAYVALAATQVVLLIVNVTDAAAPVDIYTPVVRLATFAVSFALCVHSQVRGRRASATQSIFWFLTAACEPFAFRTNLIKGPGDNDGGVGRLRFVVAIVFYPLVLLQLILNSFGEPKPRPSPQAAGKDAGVNKPCPEWRASLWSRLTFLWFDSLVWKGFRAPLQHSDLYDLNREDKSDALVPRFVKYWNAAREKAAKLDGTGRRKLDESNESSRPLSTDPEAEEISACGDFEPGKSAPDFKPVSILVILLRMFWPTLLYGTFMKMTQDGLSFVHPEVIKYLFAFVDNTEAEWKGYLYSLTLFFTTVAQFLLVAQYYSSVYMVGLRARTVLINAIYSKALRKPQAALNVGQVIDLVSFDVPAMIDFLAYADLVWSIPLHVIVSFYFLWKDYFGPSVLAGLGVIVLALPVQFLLARKQQTLSNKMLRAKDERLKLTTDVLNGMKTVKLNTLEGVLSEQILQVRAREMRAIKAVLLVNFASDFLASVLPLLSTTVTFITFVLVDEANVLDASRAFLGLIYFSYISFPISFIPLFTRKCTQAKVSLNRVTLFLNSPEIQKTDTIDTEPSERNPQLNKDEIIVVQKGTFTWGDALAAFGSLSNVSLRLRKGSLVGVVGAKGAGKSSVLHSLMGTMHQLSGCMVKQRGLTVSYVAQQPWIRNATVMENITFLRGGVCGAADAWYEQVLRACALNPDLKGMPAGDQTEIGEHGSTLSSGQKSRVALARAVYCDTDIYLLDDPLSTVDAVVGKSLFDNVIGRGGLLRSKTRVFVTNQVPLLPHLDYIVYVESGIVVQVGAYDELIREKGPFAQFLSSQNVEHIATTTEVGMNGIAGGDDCITVPVSEMKASEGIGREAEESWDLVEVEKVQEGIVKLGSYFLYLQVVGWAALLVMVLHFCTQLLAFFSNRWLTWWTEDADPEATRDYYLGGYVGFTLSVAIVSTFTGVVQVHGSVWASLKLHAKMLGAVLASPMWFFDTNPVGRIINRFSGDISTCDLTVAANMKMFFAGLITVGFDIYAITSVTPNFVYVILPAIFAFTLLQRFYITSWRQVTRLEMISGSPILAWINETLNSVASTTIRAHKREADFTSAMRRKVDHNQVPTFAVTVFRRSVKIRVDMLSNLLFLSAAIFTVWGRDNLTSGLVGLSITYARMFGTTIVSVMQWLADMETNVVSLERVREYTKLEPEGGASSMEFVPHTDAPSSPSAPVREWPLTGAIVFSNFEAQYNKRPELVLRGLDFRIQSAQKICIVGRTGAGKSTLALTLLRLIERTGGSIEIDGRNISNVGVAQLRGALTIVSQDPAMFPGTFRSNLDPFRQYSDDRIWQSLESVQLKPVIESFPEALGHKVDAGSTDILSLGQRQLFHLARALLRAPTSKILILDEATSALDSATDRRIQGTILALFRAATVLVICHRLNPIVDLYDKVMVLDGGQVIEFDHPRTLSRDPGSVLSGMLRAAGLRP